MIFGKTGSRPVFLIEEIRLGCKDYGYEAELAVPLQSNDLASVFWVGRTANAEAFGKAWDAWRDAQSDPASLAAKLEARFQACGQMIQARRSYDVY